MTHARYLMSTSLRARVVMIPAAALLFTLIGVFSGKHNEIGPTWGLTALLLCGLTTWLVGAILDAEPPIQQQMATVAQGGMIERLKGEVWLLVAVAVVLPVPFIACPVIFGRFDSAPQASQLIAAALAHVACCMLGGAIAVAFARPRITRRAMSVSLSIMALLGLVALSVLGKPIGGPVALAGALTDARPNALNADEITGALVCAFYATTFVLVAAVLGRRT